MPLEADAVHLGLIEALCSCAKHAIMGRSRQSAPHLVHAAVAALGQAQGDAQGLLSWERGGRDGLNNARLLFCMEQAVGLAGAVAGAQGRLLRVHV